MPWAVCPVMGDNSQWQRHITDQEAGDQRSVQRERLARKESNEEGERTEEGNKTKEKMKEKRRKKP